MLFYNIHQQSHNESGNFGFGGQTELDSADVSDRNADNAFLQFMEKNMGDYSLCQDESIGTKQNLESI